MAEAGESLQQRIERLRVEVVALNARSRLVRTRVTEQVQSSRARVTAARAQHATMLARRTERQATTARQQEAGGSADG